MLIDSAVPGLIPAHNWMSRGLRQGSPLATFQLFPNALEKVPCDAFSWSTCLNNPTATLFFSLSPLLYGTSVILLTWKLA